MNKTEKSSERRGIKVERRRRGGKEGRKETKNGKKNKKERKRFLFNWKVPI